MLIRPFHRHADALDNGGDHVGLVRLLRLSVSGGTGQGGGAANGTALGAALGLRKVTTEHAMRALLDGR